MGREEDHHLEDGMTWTHFTSRSESGRFTCRWSNGRVAAYIGKKLICLAPTFAIAQAECERYAVRREEAVLEELAERTCEALKEVSP